MVPAQHHGLRERTAFTMKRTGGGGDSDAAEVASETELKFTLTSPITITERK